MPTPFCAMFWLRKGECSESFESERLTMLIDLVVNCGEKPNNCGCANKWEWISVNGSRIGLVGWIHEKLVRHLKLHLLVHAVFKNEL